MHHTYCHVALISALCECGCGNPAPLACETNRSRGWIKGQPIRFIDGHNKRGAGSPFWRGGTSTYRSATKAQKKAGTTREHRVVAERVLGHSLPSAAVVHHVNGNPSDNRPSNLVICENQAYHLQLHARQRAVDAATIAVRCAWCQKLIREGRGPASHSICTDCSAKHFPEVA